MKQILKKIKLLFYKTTVNLFRKLNFPKKNSDVKTQNFLIVNTTALGDCLMVTPALKSLRESFPESRIIVLTSKTGKDVFSGSPFITNLFVYKKGISFLKNFKTLLKLRKEKINTVLIFHISDRLVPFMCYFTGARKIIGVKNQVKGMDFIFTDSVKEKEGHALKTKFEILKKTGAEKFVSDLCIHFSDKDEKKAADFLKKQGAGEKDILIGFNPGAKDFYKRWSAENFIKLGNLITEYGKNFKIIVTGDKKEKELGNKITGKIKNSISSAGELSIKETAALIRKCACFITNDTGPMHIALALNVSVIALFGPTNPFKSGPYNQENAYVIKIDKIHSPCKQKKCRKPLCMDQITVNEVFDKFKEIMEI